MEEQKPVNAMQARWDDASVKVEAFINVMKSLGVLCSVQFTADSIAFAHATAIPGILQIGALAFAKEVTMQQLMGHKAFDQVTVALAANPELQKSMRIALGIDDTKS